MPFVFWNVSDVYVEHCECLHQLWHPLVANCQSSLCQGSATLVTQYYEWHKYVV